MLTNTGTVSFILYGIFIFVTVTALIVAVKIIKNNTIPADRMDKMIELFKYAIVTTSIATVSLVISDLFKEREQDVNELVYFDKYANDIKKVDGINERLQLSKYLSIVAPSGSLKTSWKNYYDSVLVEYAEYLRLKKEEKHLDTITNPTIEQQTRKQEVKESLTIKESPLVSYSAGSVEPAGKSAAAYEQEGFNYLLAKDVTGAINAFIASENANNGYHMVYDISKYLRTHKDQLSTSESAYWKTAYSDILKNFSWKMPADVKQQLQKDATL